MSWWRRSRSDYGGRPAAADGRPPGVERERQAETIRYTLRAAGCAERGERHGGFVVEAPENHGAFLVHCSDDPRLDRGAEEQRYQRALATAGFGVVTGIDGDEGRLWVWPAGVRPQVPRPSPRELAEDWLRTLTITGEPGITADRAMEQIAQVNQPRSLGVRLRTPLAPDDAQVLEETVAWYAEVRSRQAGLHLLVEGLLIGWLADATGQDRGAIVQRLALAIEMMLGAQ